MASNARDIKHICVCKFSFMVHFVAGLFTLLSFYVLFCVICIIIRCCYVGMIYFDALVYGETDSSFEKPSFAFYVPTTRKILQNDKLWFKFYEWKVAVCCTVICVVVRECVPTTVCVYVYQHTLIDTHTQSRKSAASLENIHYYEGFANIY